MITRKQYLIPRLAISLSIWLLIMTLFLAWHDGLGKRMTPGEQDALTPLMILAPREFQGRIDINRSQEWFVQFPKPLDRDMTNWIKARYEVFVLKPEMLVELGFQVDKPLMRIRSSQDLLEMSQATADLLPQGFYLYPHSMGSQARRHLIFLDIKIIGMSVLGISMLIVYGTFTRGLKRKKARQHQTAQG